MFRIIYDPKREPILHINILVTRLVRNVGTPMTQSMESDAIEVNAV